MDKPRIGRKNSVRSIEICPKCGHNLIEVLRREANRRRELLKEYEAIGSAGAFGAMFLKQDIKRAEESIAGGNIVEMVATYKKLSEAKIRGEPHDIL